MRAIYIGGLACCSLFAVSLCQAKTVSQFEAVKSSQEQQAYKLYPFYLKVQNSVGV